VSAWYTAQHIADAVEGAIRETRAKVLAEERERVARAIYLFGNTLADPRCAAAVHELLPFLAESADRQEADRVTQ
jgi:hypothetical protein